MFHFIYIYLYVYMHEPGYKPKYGLDTKFIHGNQQLFILKKTYF
jgi:hypothetical protein